MRLCFLKIFPIFDLTANSEHTEILKSGTANFFLNPSMTFTPLFFTTTLFNNSSHDIISDVRIFIILCI